jgi:hypothetical protein
VAIPLAIAAAAFAALALRLPSLVSTVLAAYLALVANVGLVTWALSPFHAVTGVGLAAAEAVLLVAAFGAWWLRGRPQPGLAAARVAAAHVRADPATVLLLAVAVAALAYELLLALTVPSSNWDSLTYHLSRAAAWRQEHAIEWIPNAPTDRLNEFQPFAEQQILFLFVATGSAVVYALPQYVAQLAILVAVYGAARRLGFDSRAAAGSSALLATFSLLLLESTTAQNDLVAAAFPVVAACLLLSAAPLEAVLAGVALALGLGAKLTTLLAWPVLAWLAWAGGRRTLGRAAAGVVAGFVAVSVWSFVLNADHTGNLLGHGGGRTEAAEDPSVVGTIHTAAHVFYRVFDLSVLSNRLVAALAVVGVVAATTAAAAARRAGSRHAAVTAAAVGAPFLAPLLVVGGAAVYAWLARTVHLPVQTDEWGADRSLNRKANEDESAFGPLGTVALVAAPLAAIAAYALRRGDVRRLALAVALPSYLVLLGIYAKYNIFTPRFLVTPAALTAPLFGSLIRPRAGAAALAAVAAVVAGLTLAHNVTKPLGGEFGRPWELSQREVLAEAFGDYTGPRLGDAIASYERAVPRRACVGAVLDPDEPSYPLWGPELSRRVYFLPSAAAVETAYRRTLSYVVVSRMTNAPVADTFTNAGWRRRPLGDYWTLVSAPGAADGICRPG